MNLNVSIASNTSVSTVLIYPPSQSSLQITIVYTILIGISVTLNSTIFLIIVCNGKLRKRVEMVALANVSGWETFYGIVYTWLGIKTLALTQLGPVEVGMTPMECMLQFYNLGMALSAPPVIWSLAVLALDRFVCVVSEKFYSARGKLQKIAYISIPCCFGVANLLLCILGTIPRPSDRVIHPALCTLSVGPEKQYINAKDEFIMAPAGLIGSVFYVAAMVRLCCKKKSVYPSVEKAERSRQLVITKFFSMLFFVTFFALFIPRVITVVVSHTESEWFNTTGLFYFSIPTTTHSAIYGCLFWTRNSDVRAELLRIVRNIASKTMSRSTIPFERCYCTNQFKPVEK